MTLEILLTIVFFALSVIIHEVSHGFIANKLGDPTAKLSGRLTLNPVSHIDPIGSILVPALLFFSGTKFLFGWAKPVPINPINFTNPKKDILKVSIAGPVSNLIIGFIAFVVWRLVPETLVLSSVMVNTFSLNIALAIFNMIPVFPLDGSKVLAGLLPYNLEYKYRQYEKYGTFILLFIIFTGLTGVIFQFFAPIILGIYSLLTFWI